MMVNLTPPNAPGRRLLDFLAEFEAPKGYDTVYANKMALMPKRLTTMTLDEAIAQGPWRYKTFGSSACGRYQFMETTLRNLKRVLKLSGSEVMTPAFQDALAYKLLRDRRFLDFMAGRISVAAFGRQLAMEWASLPVLAATQGQHRWVARGQSYYLGDKQNKSLVSADRIQNFLTALQRSGGGVVVARPSPPAEPAPELVAAPVVDAPKVPTVVPTAQAIKLPWWARLFGAKTKPPINRLGLHPNGDPELWDVQKALQDRAYYTKGRLDGLDGTLTQEAVAQVRKDNGLGDGGIDAAFLAALPGFPSRPVAQSRLEMTLGDAAKQRPEVFNPLKVVIGGALGSIGLGGADVSGVLDKVQTAAGKASDVMDQAQTTIGTVTSVVGFLVQHRGWIFLAVGLYGLVWGLGKVADAWIKVKRAWF